MARRLRIQYPGAIYHVMARGNAGQDIVGDDADLRLLAELEESVRRSSWVLYAIAFMTNHLHVVLKTPRANLATGMQLSLSSYATWWARRHRAGGHLFQSRYRNELVEDETYLSRPESVPSLARKFSRLLADQAATHHDSANLERQLELRINFGQL